MPTNLPDEAKAKWAEAQATRDPARKLQLLREFYSLMPKHKATERLEVSIKRQIKGLQQELERARTRRTGSTRLEWVVRKEGAIQLALAGSLATALDFFRTVTNVNVTVHEALMRPAVAVLEGASVQFQLLLTPYDATLSEEKLERFTTLARHADGVVIVVSGEPAQYVQTVADWFEEHNIDLRSDRAVVELCAASTGGLRIVGAAQQLTERQVRVFLEGFHIRNAVVKLSRGATLDDLERAVFGRIRKRAIVIQYGVDGQAAGSSYSLVGPTVPMPGNRDDLARLLLDRLDFIRIYTKGVNESPARRPVLLPRGSTVIDVAATIHKDLALDFHYARMWRAPRMQGVRVGRHFPLADGDIVEIRA